MPGDSARLRLWLVAETPGARLYSTKPKGEAGGAQAWVPRSMVDSQTKFPPDKPGDWPLCDVRMDERVADEKGLL